MSICPIDKGHCCCQPQEGIGCHAASPSQAIQLAYKAGKDIGASPAPVQVPEGFNVVHKSGDVVKVWPITGQQAMDIALAISGAAAPSAPAAHEAGAQGVDDAAPPAASGWIPVGGRRPGVGVAVLGFWKNSAGPHSHITGQNYGITARNEHGLWYDASEDDNEDDEWMRPDYWQPLPPPPAIANQESEK